jgi:thioesterase domain-containing protein
VTANFFEAGGHSILAIHLVKQVNDHFGEVLELRHIFQMQTIREMAEYVDQQQHVSERSSPQSNLLELKQQQAPVKPLFLVHPVGGFSHSYLELALTLDYPGRVLGLQDDDHGPDVIEDMVRKYIDIIKLEQSHGPYLLGGWSMGGVVAYEISRQLLQAGESVDLLLMIDSFCPNPDIVIAATADVREKLLLQTMASELGISDEGLSPSEKAALDDMPLPDLMSLFIRLGKEQNRLPADFSVDDLTRRYQMLLKNTRALEKYRPLPLDIEIQLVRAQANTNPDWSLGWDSVAKEVTVHELAGNHFSLLRQPNVVELRQLINKLLSTDYTENQSAKSADGFVA